MGAQHHSGVVEEGVMSRRLLGKDIETDPAEVP
jgi:hypothetical protein